MTLEKLLFYIFTDLSPSDAINGARTRHAQHRSSDGCWYRNRCSTTEKRVNYVNSDVSLRSYGVGDKATEGVGKLREVHMK